MKTRKNLKLDTTVERILEMLMYIKIYHWKTHSYSSHKATDHLYDSLNEHMDKFVEIVLGKNPNLPLKAQISVRMLSSKKFISKTNALITHLESLNIDDDLQSVRDDIVGELNQFLFLLSLK
jgi:DNA-binding ferritin-like protein